jgi:hypothetical protein
MHQSNQLGRFGNKCPTSKNKWTKKFVIYFSFYKLRCDFKCKCGKIVIVNLNNKLNVNKRKYWNKLSRNKVSLAQWISKELQQVHMKNRGLDSKSLAKVNGFVQRVVFQIIQKYSNYLYNGKPITKKMLISGKRATVHYMKQFSGFSKYRKEAAILFNEMIHKNERGVFSLVKCNRILTKSKLFRFFKKRCHNICKKQNDEENEVY